MSNRMDLIVKVLIPTLEEMENVLQTQEVLRLVDINSSAPMLEVYNQLFQTTQFQFVLTPAIGLFTPVVFSVTVVPHQITQFLVLVMMPVEIGRLKTHGELDGVKMVSSD